MSIHKVFIDDLLTFLLINNSKVEKVSLDKVVLFSFWD